MNPAKLIPILLLLHKVESNSPHGFLPLHSKIFHRDLIRLRGGSSELSLDERVNAAMRRLGLTPIETELGAESRTNDDSAIDSGDSKECCDNGVCELPPPIETTAAEELSSNVDGDEDGDTNIESIARKIANEFEVPSDIAMAALFSSFSGQGEDRRVDIDAAKRIVRAEVEAIRAIPEDCDEVKQLVDEGFNPFLSRRSLAFSDKNVDDARAILIADQEDEDAERRQEEQLPLKTITVEYPKHLDPSSTGTTQPPPDKPIPAKKSDVVFEGTASDLQSLVIESPVPVLLDIYADWCGPCKQLTPALEQICMNAGGMLRLVKINTDTQRQISSALEVTSLPTVFGIRDGKIVNMFQGVPREEATLRNFLMGLVTPGPDTGVTPTQRTKFDELSSKLIKLGSAASFSFSAREGLQNKILRELDGLADEIEGKGESTMGMAVADDAARVLRSLVSNVIGNPFEEKFRRINLENKVIASKIAKYRPCLSILKSIGFIPDGENALSVAKGKKVVNVAPFVVCRDCIDKWIDKNRYQIAAAARKRTDELERIRLAAEAEERMMHTVESVEEPNEEDEDEELDTDICTIMLRVEGKKKIHEIEMSPNDSLADLLDNLPFSLDTNDTFQFTCAAKRLIVKSTDTAMQKTLSDLNLPPAATLVLKMGESTSSVSRGSLAERASSTRKKTGSHSMHSIGLYAKDDGNKAELFDGGGGVMYEHDVTDDEEEVEENGGGDGDAMVE